ncbi:MAG TPA: DUF1684 domain-containing protein [Rhodanobacteraceae bacterium]|nr:DUF1684 domain-containing protein [Rhodanobacteraceae bacterium]
MMTTALLLASAIAAAAPAATPGETPADYTQTIQQWRADRIVRLKAPDGWLSLVGLDWLKPGANRIGSAEDNDIVLKVGPPHLGTVTLADDGSVAIALDKPGDATIDGKHVAHASLLDDSHDHPTIVAIGSTEFYLIEREGKHGLRIKNPQAPSRTGFTGIDSYPIDPSWRIVAKWVPFDPVHHVQVATRIGTLADFPVPGKAVFERDGHTYTVLPVIEVPGDTELFVMFADRTSGKTTYGAGRFLYAAMPKDGKIVLDFNKAYNPPCAFTPYATCPLPPPENRLGLAVTAGEKTYTHGE